MKFANEALLEKLRSVPQDMSRTMRAEELATQKTTASTVASISTRRDGEKNGSSNRTVVGG